MRHVNLALLVAVALLAAACAGSDPVGSSEGAETAQVRSSDSDVQRLITELGSDEAAADALIIAMDRGYTGPQILEAVDSSRLRLDGTIEGEQPAAPALNLVAYELDGEGEEAVSNEPMTSGGAVMLVGFFQAERTPIEQIRTNAGRAGIGRSVTEDVLILLRRGFTPADVIEVLIFGTDGTVDHPRGFDGPDECERVADEIYCPDGERFAVPDEPDESVASDEPASVDDGGSESIGGAVETWMGTLTIAETSAISDPANDLLIEINRDPGTDSFRVHIEASAASETFTGSQGMCDRVFSYTYDGVGTFYDEGALIGFFGDLRYDRDSPNCAGFEETSLTEDIPLQVFVTDEGMIGSLATGFTRYDFVLDGAPTPVGD